MSWNYLFFHLSIFVYLSYILFIHLLSPSLSHISLSLSPFLPPSPAHLIASEHNFVPNFMLGNFIFCISPHSGKIMVVFSFHLYVLTNLKIRTFNLFDHYIYMPKILQSFLARCHVNGMWNFVAENQLYLVSDL